MGAAGPGGARRRVRAVTADGAIEYREPGLQTTVQDYPGRVGLWRVGIPPSGPMDSLAFRLANLLVGNAPGAAALEIQFAGPTLAFHAETAIALTGPGCDATLDGEAMPLWQTVPVRRGQVLRCPYVRGGARLYFAVAGGIEREVAFGSRATFWQSGIGGAALKAGDVLAIGAGGDAEPIRWVAPDSRPAYPEAIEAEVASGPHFDWLSKDGQRVLLTTAWRVTGRSGTAPKSAWTGRCCTSPTARCISRQNTGRTRPTSSIPAIRSAASISVATRQSSCRSTGPAWAGSSRRSSSHRPRSGRWARRGPARCFASVWFRSPKRSHCAGRLRASGV